MIRKFACWLVGHNWKNFPMNLNNIAYPFGFNKCLRCGMTAPSYGTTREPR